MKILQITTKWICQNRCGKGRACSIHIIPVSKSTAPDLNPGQALCCWFGCNRVLQLTGISTEISQYHQHNGTDCENHQHPVRQAKCRVNSQAHIRHQTRPVLPAEPAIAPPVSGCGRDSSRVLKDGLLNRFHDPVRVVTFGARQPVERAIRHTGLRDGFTDTMAKSETFLIFDHSRF